MSQLDKSKLKVAISCLCDVTYVTRFHRNVKTLKDIGLQVRCFSVKPRGTDNSRTFEGVLIDGWTRRFRHKIFGPLRQFEVVLRFLFAIIKYKPDILYAHNVPALLISYIATCLLGKGKRVLIYDAMELECARISSTYPLIPFWLRNFQKLFLEKTLTKKVDLVTSADYARTEFMKKRLGRNEILTCRNVPVFKEIKSKKLLRKHLKLPEDTFVFLYQGLIGTGRGIEQGIRSLKGLPDKIVFVVMGMSAERYIESLIQLAEAETVSKRVFFLPPVPSNELLEWTASADVVHSLIENACLSYYLAAPNKLYEAAMAGVPVIASCFPEMEAVLKKHSYGILVAPDSVDQIRNALLTLYKNDDSIIEKFRDNALSAARSELNWEMESRPLRKQIIEIISKIPQS